MTYALPPLTALRAFEAVVRLGGIGPAARELHVTPGAISRQLQVLETRFEVRLFGREGRQLVPTAAARHLAEAAGSAFSGISDAIARLQRTQGQAPLVLGCPASVLARWIIPHLSQLETDLPDLRLHLSPRENVLDARLTGLDAALLLAEPPWPEPWKVRKLAAERIGPVLAAGHPAAGQLADSAPSALLSHALLHTSSRPQAWPQWAAASGLAAAMLRFGTGFEHLYYLLEAASAGLGIAIAPEPLVREDIKAGRLLAPWGFVETPASWILCTPEGAQDPRADQLAEWLQRALAASQTGRPSGSPATPVSSGRPRSALATRSALQAAPQATPIPARNTTLEPKPDNHLCSHTKLRSPPR